MNNCGEYRFLSSDLDDYEFLFSLNYQMYSCPVCHKVTLLEIYHDEMMHPLEGPEEKVIFPVSGIDDPAIPTRVKEAFESALKLRKIDTNACSMQLRRAMEIILVDQGAKERGLKDKIEEIANKGILPASLKEATFLTKKFGDSAAHGNELIADSTDIDSLIDFTEYVIEYLYIIPAKIQQFKKRIELQEEK
jgi:hypothetical protein